MEKKVLRFTMIKYFFTREDIWKSLFYLEELMLAVERNQQIRWDKTAL